MTKNVKVGIFVLVGILLFAAGLFLIGNHKQILGHHYDIYTEFAKVDTLEGGAKIRVSGMDAGEVSSIEIPKEPSGKFVLKLHIDERFRNVVRQDSVASIETEGMVGNKFVNISKGTDRSPACTGDCILPSEEPVEIGDLLRKGQGILSTAQTSISNLERHADAAIGHADSIITGVSGNVKRIASNGAQISDGVNQLVSGLESGRGTAGKLLTDQEMAQKVDDTILQFNQTSQNVEQASKMANDLVGQFQSQNIPQDVHQTVANARDMSQELKTSLDSFLTSDEPNQNTGQVLRETINEAHRATTNLASDTEAIKHNFFLRGFFHRRGFYNLTQFNAKTYASSQFVKHPAQRIWLSADRMFAASADGAQQLSPEGRSTLDRAISQLSDELPNNPVMVEGYADQGAAAQRYLTASERAQAVKRYLQSKYQLKPDLIGTIPFEDRPPAGAGKETWNGVCLTLVVSRK